MNTNIPEISVIVPLYNRKHYIQQSMESVLNQTFDDYEILIIDDQSTDGGYELCKELYGNNPKVKLIRKVVHQRGLGESRNLGIQLARGKYIAFLDSDDLYVRTGLENVYKVAESTNAQIVHAPGWAVSEDDNGATIKPTSKLKLSIVDKIQIKNVSYLTSDIKARLNIFLNTGFCLNAWSKFYLRDYLLKNAITFPNCLSEDITFTMLNLIYAERYVRVPFIWNIYRISPDSISFGKKDANFLPKFFDSIFVGLKHMNEQFSHCHFIKENPEYANILRTHFVTNLLSFYLIREDIYNSDSLETLKKVSETALGKYFNEDQLAFVSVIFNNFGIYQSRTRQLYRENQSLKEMLKTQKI